MTAPGAVSRDVEDLLAGLQVGSLAELRELVERGRQQTAACPDCGRRSDECPRRWPDRYHAIQE